MKFSTFFGIVLEVILIGLINGEVNFCLEFASKDIKENEGSLKEVSILLNQIGQEIKQEIKEIIKDSVLGAETGNYTNFHLNFSHPAITLEGDFSNGTTYTSDQIIRLWTIKDGGLEIFNLTFPYIFMDGSYNASGYVGANRLFDIYGHGTFNLTMNNFSVAAVTGLKINSSALCVPLSVYVYLKDYQSDFVNFMNGDDQLEPLLNGAIQDLVPDAVRIIFRESMDGADPYIQAMKCNMKISKIEKLVEDIAKSLKGIGTFDVVNTKNMELMEALPMTKQDDIVDFEKKFDDKEFKDAYIIDKIFHGTTSQSLPKLLYTLANNKDQLESILKNV